MPNIEVLTTREPESWKQVLGRCVPHDFYHLPEYHALAEEAGEGAAHLFCYTEGGYTIALPLLLRSLDGLPFLPPGETNLRDATSVYGYPGPVCSHQEVPGAVVQNFQSALRERLRGLRVVAVFSRLHPFFSPLALLSGLGERQVSRTVSIDLTLPLDVQRICYRKSLKEGINRLRRLGLCCLNDQNWLYLEDFIRIYHETMHRVEAADRYFFPPAYFQRLREALGPRIRLFVCLQEGQVVASGLFSACHGILQYHLGGTLNEALKLAPMKLVMDEVRLWGYAQGLNLFHLGGGATSRPDDSLLYFKMGFSDRVHEFSVWRWVLCPEVYHRLCAEKSRWNEGRGLRDGVPNYFPEYRCPTVPGASAIDTELEAVGQEAPADGPCRGGNP